MPDNMTNTLQCTNCSAPVVATPSAPHKHFCSGRCRQAWWDRKRREGLALVLADLGERLDKARATGAKPCPER
jgi:hypothetical protein